MIKLIIHTVQSGDTLSGIARRYGVSVQRLLSDNGLKSGQALAVGQAIIVLLPEIIHTVKRGETLYSVAAAYGITVYELMQNNPELALSTVIYPGQTLAIRFSGEKYGEITLNGYAYPHINENVLRRALPYLTYLTVFGYGFTESGGLIGINDAPLISLAYSYGVHPVMLLSSITGDGGFSTEKASRLFNDVSLQNRVLDSIINTMLEKGYVGLDSDFEYISASDADAYAGFLGNAAARLHEYGFFLNTDLAPKASENQSGLLYEAHDYPVIGGITDTALLMTYEWGYSYGPPMAVAPINQVERVVNYAVSEIPAEKLLLGIPNYGYNWTLPYIRGESKAPSIGNQYAVETAMRVGAEIKYDQTAQSPYFTYRENGVSHEVWFEDVRSIEKKLALISRFGLHGAGYWTVMRPFAQSFALISARYKVRKTV